jgi:hypothetical protein
VKTEILLTTGSKRHDVLLSGSVVRGSLQLSL